MKIALIGRSQWLYETAKLVIERGFTISSIITSKEAPEYKVKSSDFEKLAKDIGVPFLHTSKLGDKESIEFLRAQGHTDIALSVNYSGVIPDEVIDCFDLGILNAHGGDLPKYRGNACQAWAILNGEDKIGLCIHNMIGGELDSGKIIARDYMPIDLSTKVGDCFQWMDERIPPLFLDAVEALNKDREFVIEVQSTDPADALRCYPRTPDDGLIDWTNSSIEIMRLINASNKPFSGAFSHFKNEKLIIWDAQVYQDDEVYLAVCGQVLKSCKESGYIIVATGDGKLRIDTVEYRGDVVSPSKVIKSIRSRLN